MAVRGFFYNATNLNDKEHMYNGQDMNEDKAPFYKEGVAYGHLQVTAPGGTMEVTVDGGTRTGYAYINLHTIHNTAPLTLTLSQASGTLPRIDRIVLRNDETERKPSIYVLEGAFSSNPQAPELVNNDVIQEKSLARVYVAAGAVEITQADITDERPDKTVCGFVGSQFEELDFSQWSAQFNNGFQARKRRWKKTMPLSSKSTPLWCSSFKRNGRHSGTNGLRQSRSSLPGTWPENCSCRLMD